MSILLGCIADDFTGGTDLAGMLAKQGMRTLQLIGVPSGAIPDDVDAVVIALKTRTTPPEQAVHESVAALRWLRALGCNQFFFKYCSTFDSTPQGNIGPVADALLSEIGDDFTVACPALPVNGRTVYQGHLFVSGVLLSESGMRSHPLTPMRDANLVRVLQAQTSRKVGLVDHAAVRAGTEVVRNRLHDLRAAGYGYAIVDALDDADLQMIGQACADLPLITGGSGVAQGLHSNFRANAVRPGAGWVAASVPGKCAVIAGSCSSATNEQVHVMRAHHPALCVSPLEIARGEDIVGKALEWAKPRLAVGPVLVYASAAPDQAPTRATRRANWHWSLGLSRWSLR